MILGLAICAGTLVYIGDKLYRQFRQHSRKPVQKPSRQTLPKTVRNLPAQQTLATHHHYLTVSAVSLGIVLFNANPLVAALNVGFMAYTTLPMIWLALRKLKSRGISHDFLLSCVAVLCFATGKHVAFLLNNVFYHFGKRLLAKAQDQTEREFTHLFEQQPVTVWVLKDGIEIEMPLRDLTAGDVVVVNTGAVVPIDGTVTEGFATLDQYALTGESAYAEKQTGDRVFASTLVIAGRIGIQAEKTGEATMIAQIGRVLNQTTEYTTGLQMKGEKWADWSGLPILAMAGVSYPLLGIQGATALSNSGYGNRIRLFGSLGTLNYLSLAAHHGMFIKDGRAFEELTHVDTVVFDKTGTLTEERLHVHAVFPCDGVRQHDVVFYAAIAEQKLSHPIANAILDKAAAEQMQVPGIDDAMYHLGYGMTVVRGADTIRVGSRRFLEQEGIELPPALAARLQQPDAGQGTLILVALNTQTQGAIELRPVIRPEAEAVLAGLRALGIRECMIVSGDAEAPTRALAYTLGVERYAADVLPEQKAEIIRQLQQEGRRVCFVGDGINDAIAMKTANVAVSLRGATTLATDVAQVVLMDNSLAQLDDLFVLARQLSGNLTHAFAITLVPVAINLIGIFFLNFHVLMTIVVNEGIGMGVGFANAVWPLRTMLPSGADDPSFPDFQPDSLREERQPADEAD